MHPFWKKVLTSNIFRQYTRNGEGRPQMSRFLLAKEVMRIRLRIKRLLLDSFFIALGVASAGFGLKGFLLPNKFIDGGAVGISLLLAGKLDYSLATILVFISIPFIILGWRNIGKEFAIKTAVGIIALSAAVAFIPYPEITEDKLLIAVFGGFFLGLGIGLAMRGGGVIDGTEVLAITLSKRFELSIGDILLIINVCIFSVAAYLLSVETALYAILTYMSASKTVDFVIEGVEEYTSVTIVSRKHDEIMRMIAEEMGRGVTIYKGEKGFGKRGYQDSEVKILFTVVTRLEISRLNLEIENIDPQAFVVMSSIKDTKGGMIKKRPLSH